MDVRSRLLIAAYRMFPFSLKGDACIETIQPDCELSCIINFYGRIQLLEGILFSLADQDMPKERFEVILVEDRGGTDEGRKIAGKFGHLLNMRYFPLLENYGKMGFSRNYGLSKARGKYALFLDDDTVILQKHFLTSLLKEFASGHADAVVPQGSASYCLLRGRYGFHDPYFPTNRCMAYRMEVLRELGGFVSEIVGQEDVELVMRFIVSGRKFQASGSLCYFHPPLIVDNVSKSAAVGLSFARLRKRYPFIVWLLMLINGTRYLPLLIVPARMKWRMQGRFSLGFLLGVGYAVTGRKASYN